MALSFPQIDPVAFTVPVLGLPIRWYALAYIAGLVLGWRYIALLARRESLWPHRRSPILAAQSDDVLVGMVFGVVLGGRLGYVLFYEPSLLWTLSDDTLLGLPYPRAIAIWEGGMSFHGGFLGVAAATLLYAWSSDAPAAQLGDAVACAAPFGILFGRIANFVNGELWGRPTDVSWGVVFPGPAQRPVYDDGSVGPSFADLYTNGVNVPRHPSQLYEAALEGLLLVIILGLLVWRFGALKRPGLCIGVFLVGYGLGRFTAEFWRQFDPTLGQGGFDVFLGLELTRGQTLSVPMVLIGVAVIYYALKGAWAPEPEPDPAPAGAGAGANGPPSGDGA